MDISTAIISQTQFSKGSTAYAGIKAEIDRCDFSVNEVKVDFGQNEVSDIGKAKSSVDRYLKKCGKWDEGVRCRRSNLTLFVKKLA